jgi:hypothetical protein
VTDHLPTDHLPETALRELSTRLDVPPPPDESRLTAAVLASLDEPPRRRPTLAPRLAAAAVALLLALGVAMAVSPEVRAAVLDFLRIGAVEVTDQPRQPSSSDEALLPGEHAVTLDRAREQANFPLRLPSALGDPDAVHVADDARVVTLLYDGVRVDQFEGGLDPMYRKQYPLEEAVPTRVDGWQGVWLPDPHPVHYLGRDGRTHEQPARLAGSTLIWEESGLTYRVEGDLTRSEAVTIAESMDR